jgi:hypothetical protein
MSYDAEEIIEVTGSSAVFYIKAEDGYVYMVQDGKHTRMCHYSELRL